MDTKESFYFLHSTVLSSLSLLWSSHSLMYFSQHALTSRVLGGDLREKRWQHFPERLQSVNFLGETPEKYLQLTLTFGCFLKFCFTTLNIYFYVYGFCLRTWTFGNSTFCTESHKKIQLVQCNEDVCIIWILSTISNREKRL